MCWQTFNFDNTGKKVGNHVIKYDKNSGEIFIIDLKQSNILTYYRR